MKILNITLIFVFMLMLLGCKSTKTVTKDVLLKDNRIEIKYDSIFQSIMDKEIEKYKAKHSEVLKSSIKDKSCITDSTVLKYDANGNKISENKFRYERHELSTERYQTLLDSIALYKDKLRDEQEKHSRKDSSKADIKHIEKEKIYIEKPTSFMQEVFTETGKFFYFVLILIVVYIIYKHKKR
nr:MAG TPA: protein of unknown function (UPF0257) [Caudoviricetes sp.]DAH25505.1 MAG TPA: hypothetical protein [Caudoviricetes sp.]